MKVRTVYSEWDVNSFEQNNYNTRIVSVTPIKSQTVAQEYVNGQPVPVVREIVNQFLIVYEEVIKE
jgi:hypothetical protein